jgi:acyl-coenzyme A synthetase/AMP-(fatty) acid ligase
LLCLYTSGSTGSPEPQVKTLAQLVCGGELLGERLNGQLEGGLTASRAIVSSVPPQHMFGLESSIMLPLLYALPVQEHRPLLPADVRAAFENSGRGSAVWIAAPVHLQALVRADEIVPNCRLVVASTMALSPALAARAEALVGAPVLEVYGSTETGALATRRTAHDGHWLALDGVRLEEDVNGSKAWGSHFPSPRRLTDTIERETPDRFRLLGRDSDLIKIGGRRASLAGLNLLLQELPGLDDGVFYLPPGGETTERLVLIHAGAQISRAVVHAWLRERIDPIFLPRALIHVERLPRSENGKLSRAALNEIYCGWLSRRAPC